MEALASPPKVYSIEEYLELEERSEVRHEYVEGVLYALAGGSNRHNRIALNIASLLLGQSRSGPCRVYMSDMRLDAGTVVYYPDVMVCCKELETENPTIQRDPCLLVEVLSPSTAAKDRREKLLVYRQIPTLHAYLLVDQDVRHVERHFRDEGGDWQRSDIVNDGSVSIPCLESELTLEDIYEGI